VLRYAGIMPLNEAYVVGLKGSCKVASGEQESNLPGIVSSALRLCFFSSGRPGCFFQAHASPHRRAAESFPVIAFGPWEFMDSTGSRADRAPTGVGQVQPR
jgi:hypothetical protein